jgi:hypothetical protein
MDLPLSFYSSFRIERFLIGSYQHHIDMTDTDRKQRRIMALIDQETLDRLSGRGEISVDSIGRCYGLGEFLKRATLREEKK